MKVYIAGPYSKGDVALNVRTAVLAAEELCRRGHTPYVPHLTHLWHLISPHDIGFWYAYDMVWLKECDALLRLPGESIGADTEISMALSLGLKVYNRVEEL